MFCAYYEMSNVVYNEIGWTKRVKVRAFV